MDRPYSARQPTRTQCYTLIVATKYRWLNLLAARCRSVANFEREPFDRRCQGRHWLSLNIGYSRRADSRLPNCRSIRTSSTYLGTCKAIFESNDTNLSHQFQQTSEQSALHASR